MANRRLFSRTVTRSDAFLEMPLTTQALYFHLGLEADDDGFCSAPKTVARLIGANQNDYDLLVAKGFLIQFDDGVVVIKHWLVNNTIRKDRYKSTEYIEHKKTLYIKENQVYTLDPDKGTKLIESQPVINDDDPF
jgi:hypothetical protein